MPTFLVSDSISLAESAGRNLVVVTTDNRSAGDLVFLTDSGVAHLASNLGQRGNIDYDQIRRSARVGDGDKFHTLDIGGTKVLGNTVKFDSAGNLIDAGVTPGGGGGGSGTVTSVGLTVPAEFSVTGSPITTSGTLAVAKANQNANLVYSGPSSGAAASPTFRALVTADLPSISSGALVLLEQHTASSSAELDFTAWYSSAYDDYEIHLVNIIPATNNTGFRLRMSTNGGSSYDSGANYTLLFVHAWVGSGVTGGNASQTSMELGNVGTTANYGLNGKIYLPNPGGSLYKSCQFIVTYYNTSVSSPIDTYITCWWLNTGAVNALQFIMSSGNIASGTIRLYGVAKTTVASPDFILVNGA